jgi:type I restriction enzyme S subunit
LTGFVRLGDVVNINPRGVPNLELTDDIAFVAMADVTEEGVLHTSRTRPYAEVSAGYTPFQGGDVLLAKITPCFENGKSCLVPGISPLYGFGSTEFHVLRAGSAIDSRFLHHLVRSPKFRSEGRRRMTGSAGQKRVPTSFISDYRVVLPPIAEQRSIAAILDKADDIRKKRREALKLADEFLRSVFFELFGDPVANSNVLPEKPLVELATVTTGNTPSREIADYYGEHIEWIKSDNLNTPSHFLTKAVEGLSEAGLRVARSAPAGSTLITCIAGSPSCIGNAALADRAVSFNQQINALTPKPGIEPEFIYAATLFSKPRIQAASTNGMKGMVSKGALEQVCFICPPPDQREKFVGVFRKVMALTENLENAVRESNTLHSSLAQRAFQGQL